MLTFIQPLILAGLALLAIPILIHLFNRRKATVVEWGAMRFLDGSLVRRRRRIQLEELLLLALRCLLVALLVLAVARPFVPVGASATWMLTLPALLLAVAALAIGTVLLRGMLSRLLLYCAVAAALSAVVWASRSERIRQMEFWAHDAAQDVAIVIDASASMALPVEGESNFQRALHEARAVVESLRVGDGVAVVLAGSTPRAVTPTPVAAGGELADRLLELKPVGGSMSLIDALDAASAVLARGDHLSRRIVVITDGQSSGWSLDNIARWEHLQADLEQGPAQTKVVLRNLGLPRQFRNLSVVSIDPARRIIGTDRPVAIRVRVENTGTEVIDAEGVRLRVGETTTLTETLPPIAPGTSEVVEFLHRFREGGPQVLSARVLVNDDLPSDDARSHVLTCFASLPVLLVDGHGERLSRRQATSLVELALAPPGEEGAVENFVSTRVISATELDERIDLQEYRVVVLASVPRLPQAVGRRLAEFVERGGGLLVAPGRDLETEFYNDWRSDRGLPLLPGRIVERVSLDADARPARPSPTTFTHPALARFQEPPADLDGARFTSYWKLEPERTAGGGNLDAGHPLLLEQGVGRGRVAMTAVSLDHSDGTLPAQRSFLPLVHELIYHLASPELPEMNADLAAVVQLQLPLAQPDGDGEQADSDDEPQRDAAGQLAAEVLTPGGEVRSASLFPGNGTGSLTLSEATEAGVYRVQLPAPYDAAPAALGRMVPQSPGVPLGDTASGFPAGTGLPVALNMPAAESRMEAIGPEEIATAARFTDLFVADNRDHLLAVLRGEVPGRELWKLIVVGAMLLLLLENLLTRWVGTRRKLGTAEAVDFTNEGQRMTSRRAEAKSLVEAARQRRAARRRSLETAAAGD